MTILLLLLIICLIYKSKIFIYDFNQSYIDRNNTTIIKGFFIMLVFFSHIISYRNDMLLSETYFEFQGYMGQLIVSMFLFYSGFGVGESIKTKGNEYIKKMPVNRIIKTIVNFDLAILLFYFLSVAQGYYPNAKKILLSLIGWDSLGNSNWYIFAILVMYVITYITGYILKVLLKIYSDSLFIIFIVLFSVVYIFIIMKYKQSWWYDTALTYSAGIIFSCYKTKIEKFLQKNNINYCISIIIIMVLFMYSKKLSVEQYSIYELTSILFALMVVLISFKIRFNSKILYYCGNNLFGIYILQRIPMILFTELFPISNVYLYFGLCIVFTVILDCFYNKISNSVWKIIKAKMVY